MINVNKPEGKKLRCTVRGESEKLFIEFLFVTKIISVKFQFRVFLNII